MSHSTINYPNNLSTHQPHLLNSQSTPTHQQTSHAGAMPYTFSSCSLLELTIMRSNEHQGSHNDQSYITFVQYTQPSWNFLHNPNPIYLHSTTTITIFTKRCYSKFLNSNFMNNHTKKYTHDHIKTIMTTSFKL